ncbi:MAG: PaaI family thioesterase [Proteobacteria bacterium]|nr:PaaI family thioesterase [Pseudomonadota bacterium]
MDFETVDHDEVVLSIRDGDGLRLGTADGDLFALAVLADVTLSTALRAGRASRERLATTWLQLQFTGAQAARSLHARGATQMERQHSRLPVGGASARIESGGVAVCHAIGEFAHVGPPPGVTLGPLPWQVGTRSSALLADTELAPDEQQVLDLVASADAASAPTCLWSGRTQLREGGATRVVPLGLHFRNRVGHVQGGLLLGVATGAACAALTPDYRIANATGWYLRPAQGRALTADADVLHRGRYTAVVRTRVRDDGDEPVLECMTQHLLVDTRQP